MKDCVNPKNEKNGNKYVYDLNFSKNAKVVKNDESDESDDIDFSMAIHNLEEEAMNQGIKEGVEAGKKRMEQESIKEGKRFGLDIGNQLGYYKQIIETFKLFNKKKFEKKR